MKCSHSVRNTLQPLNLPAAWFGGFNGEDKTEDDNGDGAEDNYVCEPKREGYYHVRVGWPWPPL